MFSNLFAKGPNLNSDFVKDIKKGYLIDVREKDEFKQGHLPNAINIPLSDLNLNAKSLLKETNNTYYVYCLSGGRSNMATKSLKKLNYDVINLGGISSYTGKLKK